MGIQKEIYPGDIVTSVSGRDKNRHYIVMYAENGIVGICNGDLHKTDKIKKKNVKHIKPEGGSDKAIKEKLENGVKITDSEIRKAIAEFEKLL